MNIAEHEHIDPEHRTVDLRLLASDVVSLITVLEHASLASYAEAIEADQAVEDVKTRRDRAVDCGSTEAMKTTIYNAFDKELAAAEHRIDEIDDEGEIVRDLLRKITFAGTQS